MQRVKELTGMLLDYLWRYRVMKLRDKVKEIEPELVNDEHIGGVK